MSGLLLVLIIWAVVMVAGATVMWGPPSLGRKVLPVRHKPDYQEIARLERELGLSKDPRVVIDADGTTRVVDRGIDRPERRPMPAAPDPEFQVPDPRRPISADQPPMFKTYDDYMTYLRAKNPPPKDPEK